MPLEVLLYELLSYFRDWGTGLSAPVDELVVYVSKIRNQFHLVVLYGASSALPHPKTPQAGRGPM